MASKVILTVAIGDRSQELLDLCWPTFWLYACKFDYELHVIRQHHPDDHRHPSWHKIPGMRTLLGNYKTIVCLDVDTMICDFERDWFQQALDTTSTAINLAVEREDSQMPNGGVWIVRGGDPMAKFFLEEIDGMEDFYGANTWEQEAVHRVLGFNGGMPRISMLRCVGLLSSRYNDVYMRHDDPIVKHWAGQSHHTRLNSMTAVLEWLNLEARSPS